MEIDPPYCDVIVDSIPTLHWTCRRWNERQIADSDETARGGDAMSSNPEARGYVTNSATGD